MNSETLMVGLAILGSSFWGSWHCAAMCSPIASLMAQRRSLGSYHLGRGISYVGLGAFGGFLGSYFLASDLYSVRLYSGILFAAILLFLGFQAYRGKKTFFAPNFHGLHAFFGRRPPGIVLGLLSAFLPCGWLYSYVLAAAATQSVMAGAMVLGLFWVAGLPALSSIPLVLGKSIRLAPAKKQRISALVLVFAGLYTLMSFYFLPTSCL